MSQIKSDLKELNILETFEELQSMIHSMFKKKIRSQITEKALEYLLKKRKSKGKEIKYPNLDMAEYLLPLNTNLNIFAIRNRMINIKSNFKQRNKEKKCICGDKETMEHIWNCKLLNREGNQNEKYEKIFNGNLEQQLSTFEKFEEKLKKYTEMKNKMEQSNKHPCDPSISDPLFCKEQQGIK